MTRGFRSLDEAEVKGRRVLLRADLNVPLREGVITDHTRIERLSPTIRELADKGARVIVISHFDRPKGKRVASMSLRPVADALARVLQRKVTFAEDCIGAEAENLVTMMRDGEVLVLENTRYHSGEETNDASHAAALARHGEIYVNDAFSAAHRAHASTEGVARLLPSYAGRLLEAELAALDAALGNPHRPAAAIVGGAKVSSKLDLLGNLIHKVDLLVIGGAMANTFLAAQGAELGTSLQEPELHGTAREIMEAANRSGCHILLPVDFVISESFAPHPPTRIVAAHDVPAGWMALDVGPMSAAAIIAELSVLKTLIWNGPLGAFETPPFDAATKAVAGAVAMATKAGLISVAGGGDTVAALRAAGVIDQLTYVSTAGGAFLEWMEGKILPGVAALAVV